jgi:hypothetical protein
MNSDVPKVWIVPTCESAITQTPSEQMSVCYSHLGREGLGKLPGSGLILGAMLRTAWAKRRFDWPVAAMRPPVGWDTLRFETTFF